MACEEPIESQIDLSQRSIVGGTETNYEEWQGVVGLVYCQDKRCATLKICSGTLIDPQVVLTSAHCVYFTGEDPIFDIRTAPEEIFVRGGSNLNIFYAVGAEIAVHPDWLGDILSGSVDLAMIKLSDPIMTVESYGITKEAPAIGLQGKVVGYGLSDAIDGSTLGIHRAGNSTIQWVLNNNIFELGNPSSICRGDSGGPFLVEQDGDFNVMGVASFGTLPEECPTDHDGFFANLYPAKQWINDTMLEMVGHGINSEMDPDRLVDASVDSGTSDYTDNSAGGGSPSPDSTYPSNPAPRRAKPMGCALSPVNTPITLFLRLLSLALN